MELCKEGLEQRRFEIKYTHTSKMIADGLLKPVEGNQSFTRHYCGIRQPVGVDEIGNRDLYFVLFSPRQLAKDSTKFEERWRKELNLGNSR